MKILVIASFFCFTLSNYCLAMVALTDEPIKGKALKTLTDKTETYVLVQTGNERIWLSIPKTKIQVNKQYKFYPPYLELRDYKIEKKHLNFRQLWKSIGLFDEKYSDLTPYSFKGITIGAPMDDLFKKLKELGLDYSNLDIDGNPWTKNNGDNLRIIYAKGFKFGEELVDLSFYGDPSGKLAGYYFEISNDTPSKEWAGEKLIYFSQVFTKKFGSPTEFTDFKNFDIYINSFCFCSWKRADIEIRTNYRYKDGKGIVSNSVISLTRNVRLINALQKKIHTKQKSAENNFRQRENEKYQKGADSF